MKKFTMNFPEDLHKRLKLYCVEKDIDMAQVICRLVEVFLENEKKISKK